MENGKLNRIVFFINKDYDGTGNAIHFKVDCDLESSVEMFGEKYSYSRSNFTMDVPIELGEQARNVLNNLWNELQKHLDEQITNSKKQSK